MFVSLRAHVQAYRLGEVFLSPVDCILSETTVVQPDLVYVDPTRAHLVSERGIEGPPTLVVEILSPPTTAIDRSRKRRLYADHGVPYYWIVDPEARTIEAYRFEGDRYHLIARVSGAASVSLPPFSDVDLAPTSLWP